MFSVLHPLDEPRPVTCKVQGKVCYICDAAVSVVFTCSDPALVMTYDSVIGLHSVWEVTKAKPEVSFLNKSLISRINVSLNRAVKSREPGISPVIMNVAPAYLRRKMEEKMEPKEIPSRLISCQQCTCRIFPAT